jgi:ribosomal protein L37E
MDGVFVCAKFSVTNHARRPISFSCVLKRINKYSKCVNLAQFQEARLLFIHIYEALSFLVIHSGFTLSMSANVLQVCRKCGLLGYYNHKLKTSYCSMCKNGENMAKMRLPYACKLLFQVLLSIVHSCFNHAA